MLESLVFFLSCAECCLPGMKKEWQAVRSFPVTIHKIPLAVSMLLTLSDGISELFTGGSCGHGISPFSLPNGNFPADLKLGECNSLEKAAVGGGSPPTVSHLMGSSPLEQPSSRAYRPLVTCYMHELVCLLLSPLLEEDIVDVPAHQCYTGRMKGGSGVKVRPKGSQAVRN